jgi:hypothetical protein
VPTSQSQRQRSAASSIAVPRHTQRGQTAGPGNATGLNGRPANVLADADLSGGELLAIQLQCSPLELPT